MIRTKRILFMIALFIIVMVSVACSSGGGSNNRNNANNRPSPTNTPAPPDAQTVARTWFNALFTGDGTALREHTCSAHQSSLTDEAVAAIEAGLVGGASINTDNVTFSVSNGIITIGGTMTITLDVEETTVSNDISMREFPLNQLPIVQENGLWKVCTDLNITF